MSVRLMDRLSLAMLNGPATVAEHTRIVDAIGPAVQDFDQLPQSVRDLVIDLERRARERYPDTAPPAPAG